MATRCSTARNSGSPVTQGGLHLLRQGDREGVGVGQPMVCFDVRCGEGQAAFSIDYGDGQLVNCGNDPPRREHALLALGDVDQLTVVDDR